MTALSKEYGISDVALAKTCKKYNIPRPPRGFWSRLRNGYKDRKADLPEGEDVVVEFDVERNLKNREKQNAEVAQRKKISEEVKPVIEQSCARVHPIATRFLERIENVKPDENGLLKMTRVGLPEVSITQDSVERVSKFISLVAFALEKQSVAWLKSGNGLYSLFGRDGFSVGFEISQSLIKGEREPTLEEKKKPSWEWDLTTYTPSSVLVIVLKSESHVFGRKKWTENNSNGLVDYAEPVSVRIDELLRSFEESRIAAIEEKRRQEAQRLIDEENRRECERLQYIAEIKKSRFRELVRASMLWKEHEAVASFIDECASRWGSQLSEEQNAWLEWATENLESLSPFAVGYPDPKQHGPLDEASITEAGSSPSEDESFFRRPQLLKDIQLVTQRGSYGYSSW